MGRSFSQLRECMDIQQYRSVFLVRCTAQGLKASNVKVTELSEVRSELEAARQDNVRLAAMVAKFRTALGVRHAAGAGSVHAAENPYVAAWYRKAHADREWQRVPPVSLGEDRRVAGLVRLVGLSLRWMVGVGLLTVGYSICKVHKMRRADLGVSGLVLVSQLCINQ